MALSMNLDNFETKINPTIMARGVNYFNNALVEDLEELDTGFWQAMVEGSYLYEIDITLNKQDINQWSCTCPYDGPVCKHVAATLLSIRESYKVDEKNNTKAVTNIGKAPTKQTQLNNVFKKASHEEIVSYLRDLIKNDRKLLDKTLLNFQSYTGLKQDTIKYFCSLFNLIIKQHSRKGFIDYHAASRFYDDTWSLIKSLRSSQISSADSIKCCFEIIQIIIEKVVEAIDDSGGELSSICMDISEVLAYRFSSLNKEQKIQCFDQLLVLEFESELDNYGLDQYFDELAPTWAINNRVFQESYLKAISNAVVSSHDTCQEESLNSKKLALLSEWGREEEAENFALGKIEIPEFRKIFVTKAIRKKEFEVARSLVNVGIKLAQKKKHPGVVSDWREVLINIAKKTNDVDAIRAETMKMIESSWFKIKLYRQLKSSYPVAEWQAVQGEYAKKIIKKHNSSSVQAEIYAEENQLRELFDIIQKDERSASILFKVHLKILAKEFPEESANFYAIIIHYELEQADKKVYQQAVRDIKALKKLSMGEEIAKQLIKEVTLKYNNRPSMLDIFKRAFGENN